MAMKVSVTAPSWYIIYCMAYDKSSHLRHHYYYINLDVHYHLLSGGHGYFLSLYNYVYYSCGWICQYTTSLPLLHALYLYWTWSIFPWFYLVHIYNIFSLFEVGPICRVSMCLCPMINSHNLINNPPCIFLVNKYTIMLSVMQ